MRVEKDFIGQVTLENNYYFGISTYRAEKNFNFSIDTIDPLLFKNVILIKQACAFANKKAGLLISEISDAIGASCDEISENIEKYVPKIHPLQGGAGTSINMAANEVIANVALQQMGKKFGMYKIIHPLKHVNLSQSTNDVFMTAVKISIIKRLHLLHKVVEKCLHILQEKEKEFASILKIGRTEMQDAMPLSLGQEFGAWADAVGRFRWRIDKAVDWIREINIGGTAIGTSINADHNYLLHVIDELRKLIEEPVSLSKNLIDGTQNGDQIVEVSGIIKTGAVVFKKIAADIRLLSSGPRCGLGELKLQPLQAGSSIMPGKVNPVMLEAAEQICIQVIGGDGIIAHAVSQGNLELQQFMPLIAHTILKNTELFTNMINGLNETVIDIAPDREKIAYYVNHSFSIATLLTPVLGYDESSKLVKEAERSGRGIIDLIIEKKLIPEKKLQKLLTPEVMASPGLPVFEEDE